MNKTVILSLLLSLLSYHLQAQDYEIDWGPEYKRLPGLFTYYDLVDVTEDNYHLLMASRKESHLISYDFNHRVDNIQKIDIKKGKVDLLLNRFVTTTDGTYALFTGEERRQESWRVYAAKMIDNKVGNPDLIFEHDFTRASFLGFKFAAYSFSQMRRSHNRKRVSFVNTINFKNPDKNQQLSFAVFDEKMNLLWSKEEEFPYEDKTLSIAQTVVSDEGEVFVLAKLEDRNGVKLLSKKRENAGFVFKLFRVTESGMNEYNLELKNGIFPVDAGLFLMKDDLSKVVLGGFYSEEEKRSGLKGVFLAVFDKESTDLNVNTDELTAELLEGLVKERDLKKDRGLSTSFSIKNLLHFNDGSIGFVAEQYYVTSRTSTDANGHVTVRYTYHSNDIVIPKFNSSGRLIDISKIEKDFRSSSNYNTSYTLALNKGKVYLLYNDLKKRDERKELKDGGNRGGFYTDLSVIDENGKIIEQKTLFTSKDTGLFFLPRTGVYGQERLFFVAGKGKKYQCGRLDLY